MLSEEEKDAIAYFSVANILYNQGLKDMKYLDDMANRMNILLNLIEKLQREIKHQKQQRKYWRDNFYKQQKELKEWFEIADKILRATNDYGNITIGYIPIYIDKLQKDIEELTKLNTPMSWEMKDKDGNVVISLKKPDDYISKDKIREKRDEIQSYAFTSEEEKSKQDYAIARFNELLKEN